MSKIAKTLEVDEERIWETKVPKGLKQILIEDVAVTKAHFKLTSAKMLVNSKKFELETKEKDRKAVVSKEHDHKKKVVSEWFEGLVYCPVSN